MFNSAKFPTVISLTCSSYNSELLIKLTDFINPINSIYVRCILLAEGIGRLCIKGDRGIEFNYENGSIDISINETQYFKIQNTHDIKQLVDLYENLCYQQLLKSGPFQNIKYKKTIIIFFEELLNIFNKNNYTLSNFSLDLSRIFLDQENTAAEFNKSSLAKLVLKFVKNNIDASAFDLIYKIFVSKLILSSNSAQQKENIDNFLKQYSLN